MFDEQRNVTRTRNIAALIIGLLKLCKLAGILMYKCVVWKWLSLGKIRED